MSRYIYNLYDYMNYTEAILIDSKEKENTRKVFENLEECLGYETFVKLFLIILIDNGWENL
ncbi:hypothetical protein [Anaerovorax odorimutans]|uniref:hypothetical protein n=1 Tax=Anaerovorax odorimutans TaxID=109327 RepID=UPI0012EB96A7|nr:hypothetical protein [Anaerovorax odorimutans]